MFDSIIEVPQHKRRKKTGHGCTAKFKNIKVPDWKGGPVEVSSDINYNTLVGLLAVCYKCNLEPSKGTQLGAPCLTNQVLPGAVDRRSWWIQEQP
jgi:hypothetical protein